MSELVAYSVLGFRHIADLAAADHILFLLALSAGYRLAHWRSALWVITAFTLGHSLTLAVAVTGLVRFPPDLIEFLIPLTILLTCLENLRTAGKVEGRIPLRAGLALSFGLVHGAGFANYLRAIFVDRMAIPLLGFNIGIEIGQVVILLIATLIFGGLDRATLPFRARVAAVSAVVAVLAARMMIERSVG